MLIVIICIALIVALSVAHALISKYSLVREVLSIFLTGVIVLLVALGIIIWDVQSNGDTHLQDQLVYKTELQCCLDNFEDIPPEYKIQVVDRAIEKSIAGKREGGTLKLRTYDEDKFHVVEVSK